MKKIITLFFVLVILCNTLVSCDKKRSAYDIDKETLETLELEEGEKAIWIKSIPFPDLNFMKSVITFGSLEYLVEKSSPDNYDWSNLDTSLYCSVENIVFGTDKKVKGDEDSMWSILYDEIFSPEEFLKSQLDKEVKVDRILCFDCSDDSYPNHSYFPHEYAVVYYTNVGDYLLLMCGDHQYEPGKEQFFFVPWRKFEEAKDAIIKKYDESNGEGVMGGYSIEYYNECFKDYKIIL